MYIYTLIHRVLPKFWSRRKIKWISRHTVAFPPFCTCWNTEYVVLYGVLSISNRCLAIWACFVYWTFERHLQPDSSDGVAKFSTKLSSLFSPKHLWTLGSLRKLYLFWNVFTQGKVHVGVANGKVAVGCKTKYLFFYYLDLHAQDD